jgi:dipeptidyl-peptidase-4
MSRPITFEDVARFPRPGWAIPGALAFRPDGKQITYLFSPGGGLVRQLYALDPLTGERTLLVQPAGEGATEENLSLEEKLRRERARQLELGVTSYAWSPKGERLLVPFPDGLYLQDSTPGAGLRKVAGNENGPVLDPRFSPDGAWIAFVQASELWVAPSDGSAAPRQVTSGAAERGLTHGLAEFIAQEEMARQQGYWWSPDGEWLAFEEVDETHIPVYRIVHQGKDQTGAEAQEDHRYPFTGQPNAKVRLGVVARAGGEVTWMDLGPDEDIYLARVHWFPDGTLAVQRENRAQSALDLLRYDPRSGQGASILREESPVWINLHDAFHPIRAGRYAGGFVWASERSGFLHLYLYGPGGELIRALTGGDWMVDDLSGVDEEKGIAYFTATKETPLESHLYAVSLEGGEPRRITREPGMHQVVLDPGCTAFLDTHNALDTAPHISLRSLEDGSVIASVYENSDPGAGLALTPPELVSLPSRDGVTLYGAIYRPAAGNGSPPYPTIVSVYGGPHAQLVSNSWRMTSDLRAQYLRQQGFLVFVLDNRGSARRGLAFEGAIKNNLGDLEVRDQVDGVRWLVDQGLADPARVGIYGWSYGGYMSAMSLVRAPETFKAAVAGAPVTNYDGYDTHYTERYMSTPQLNPSGYANGSVMKHVDQMRGHLLIVHGLIDENVHFRHTARLINALIAARKPYELMLFPDERHSPRRLADRVYMEERIVDFFERELK